MDKEVFITHITRFFEKEIDEYQVSLKDNDVLVIKQGLIEKEFDLELLYQEYVKRNKSEAFNFIFQDVILNITQVMEQIRIDIIEGKTDNSIYYGKEEVYPISVPQWDAPKIKKFGEKALFFEFGEFYIYFVVPKKEGYCPVTRMDMTALGFSFIGEMLACAMRNITHIGSLFMTESGELVDSADFVKSKNTFPLVAMCEEPCSHAIILSDTHLKRLWNILGEDYYLYYTSTFGYFVLPESQLELESKVLVLAVMDWDGELRDYRKYRFVGSDGTLRGEPI